jgi:filamentous hemagglutinin
MAGGEINKAGKAAGGHSLTTGGVRIVPGTEGAPDANGVYEAAIEIYDKAADRWVRKVSNNGITTMFPKDWTAERIKLEVQAAWDGPGKAMLPYNKWEGKTPSGVTVQGFVNPHRVTAHPLADF